MRHSLTIVFALVVVAPNVRAQTKEPAQIPTILASTILGGFGEMFGSKPRFSVDEPPVQWPKKLVPAAPARVIGGLNMGFMSLTLVSYPKSVNGVFELEKLLASAGLTRAAPPAQGSGFGQMGLGPMDDRSMFCSDSLHASVAVADSTAEPRLYVITGTRPMRGMQDACNPRDMSEIGRMRMPLKLPALRAPAGARAQPGGNSYGGNSMQASVRLDTTYSASFLLNHYGKQLAAAGWQVLKSAGDDDVAIQKLITKDDKGDTWYGALIVTSTLGSRDVLINMHTEREF